MRSEEELKQLFTAYFSDKLSAFEIEKLATDVRASVQNRHARLRAASESVPIASDSAELWRPAIG